jgi:hypothetical protein
MIRLFEIRLRTPAVCSASATAPAVGTDRLGIGVSHGPPSAGLRGVRGTRASHPRIRAVPVARLSRCVGRGRMMRRRIPAAVPRWEARDSASVVWRRRRSSGLPRRSLTTSSLGSPPSRMASTLSLFPAGRRCRARLCASRFDVGQGSHGELEGVWPGLRGCRSPGRRGRLTMWSASRSIAHESMGGTASQRGVRKSSLALPLLSVRVYLRARNQRK